MMITSFWRQRLSIFLLLSLSSAQETVVVNLLVPANGSITPDTRPSGDPLISHRADSSIPAPTRFVWSAQENSQPPTYTLYLSKDSVFESADIVVSNCTDTMLSLWNLKIATPYYWKLSARDGLSNQWNSPVFSFMTADAWPRMICVDGTTNVRDIGGRRTMDGFMIRQGLFYRSAEFNQTYSITEKGISQLMALGIVCEIDLRNETENPQAVLPPAVRYVRPVSDSGIGIVDYQRGLVTTPDPYRDAFKLMADKQNYPLICHCRFGADRTGTLAAMLEAILRCSEQQIGSDYQWSSLSVNGIRDTTRPDWRDLISYLKSFDTQNGTIQAGSWNYLLAQGVTVDELMAIRKIFIDDNSTLSIKPYASIPRTIRQCHVLRFFLHSSSNFITMKKGIRKVKVFDCLGKELWEFTRNRLDAEVRVQPPLLANKTYIVYYLKETSPQ